MFTRELLQPLSLDVLRGMARDYQLTPDPAASKEELITMILTGQEARARQKGSGFIEQDAGLDQPEAEGNDGSSFFQSGENQESGFTEQTEIIRPENPGNGGSGFTGGNEGGSGFIQQTPENNGGDASGFLGANEEGSGFIQSGNEENAGSGFIQTGNDGSGFIGGDGGQGSGFIAGGGDATEHLSPLDPSGQVLLPDQPAGEKSRAHGLGPGDTLTLNGHPYTISSILSQSSGEAVIYLVQDEAGTTQVLKLYVAQQIAAREPNGTALERIRKIKHEDILPLIDFGVGAQKYQGQYCFEISAFAEGGDLFQHPDIQQAFTPDFLRDVVVPEVFEGIKTLHKNRIFHCDIKPRNIFFLDADRKDIVIGDYGSAKTFEAGSEKEAAQFSSVIGTNAYLPPEQARGFISPKNDFYSFGMVLLHLLYPEEIGQADDPRRVDMKKLRGINERQFSRKPIIKFDPRFQDFNQLIAGLTLQDDKDRWGEAEVEKWLKGRRIAVKYDETAGIKPVKLGYATIYSPEDLLNVMESHPTRWYGDLISDRHGYESLLNWVANRLDIPRKRLFDAMIQHYREDGSSYIKEAVARFFAPEAPLKIGEERYFFSDLPSLATEIRRYFKDLDEVWKINDLKKVQFSLFQFEIALRLVAQSAPSEALALIKRVLGSMANQLDIELNIQNLGLGAVLHRAIRTESKQESHSHGYLLRLFYLFDKERGFRDLNSHSYQTLDELGKYFAQNHEAYVHPILQLERAFFLNRIKRQDLTPLGLASFLAKVFSDKAEVSIEVKQVRVGADRSYAYEYTYEQSLQAYFKRQGFKPLTSEQAIETHLESVPGRWFQLPSAAWGKFKANLEDTRNIPEEIWDQSQMVEGKKRVNRSAWFQWIGLGMKEWASAALWLLPWLGIGAMFLFTNGNGDSLLQQWVEATELERYAMQPESDGDRVIGLFLPAIWGLFGYLCMLIMRIWTGERLQVIGKIKPQMPRWLSFQGLEALGFLFVAALFPLLMWVSNWLWEVLGIVLIFGFGVLLMMIPLEKNGKGLRVWRTIAGIICLLAVVRLGLEIYSWVELGFGWKRAFDGRGWIDLAGLTLISLFFLAPPFFWQPLSAYDKGRLLSKAAVLLLFAGLIFGPSHARDQFDLPNIPSISVGVPASNRLVPQTFYATVNASAANVRSGPSKGSKVLGTIARNVPFVVRRTGTEKYWWVITEGDLQGYMYFELIDVGEQVRTEDLDYQSYPVSREPK